MLNNNPSIINYITNNLSLFDNYKEQCENKDNQFCNNCFFKSMCDYFASLDDFNNIDNTFKKDIIRVSKIGGISNKDNKEDDKYQYDKNISCMASALTNVRDDNEFKSRKQCAQDEAVNVLYYIFNALLIIKYKKEYTFLDEDYKNLIKMIINCLSSLNNQYKRNQFIQYLK